MNLLAFAASHRPDSSNKKLLKKAVKAASFDGVRIDVAEYGEFDMPVYNDMHADKIPAAAAALAKRLEHAHGIIISSPEYNWSFPGSLKNIIDWLSVIKPNPLAGKTALLMCATNSARGGIVGLQQLKSPLEALGVHVYNKMFPLPFAYTALDGKGEFAESAHEALLAGIVEGYLHYTAKLHHSH